MKEQAFGIDISNYAGEMTQQKVDGMVAAGVRFCVVGFQDASLFERQVRAVAAAGIKVAGYFFIYWSRLGEQNLRLDRMIAMMQFIEQSGGPLFGWPRPDGTHMPKIWLDFEEDTTTTPATNPKPAVAKQVAADMIAQVEQYGFSVGIYTRDNWWRQWAANSPNFAGYPLWNASQYAETVPTPFSDYYTPYGGWPVPMAWQYRGDVPMVGGYTADFNLEEWEVTTPTPEPARITLTESDGRQRVFIEQQ